MAYPWLGQVPLARPWGRGPKISGPRPRLGAETTLYCMVTNPDGTKTQSGFVNCNPFWNSPPGIYPGVPDCGPNGLPVQCGAPPPAPPPAPAPPAAPAPGGPTTPAPSLSPCCKPLWDDPSKTWFMDCVRTDASGKALSAFDGPANPANIAAWADCVPGTPSIPSTMQPVPIQPSPAPIPTTPLSAAPPMMQQVPLIQPPSYQGTAMTVEAVPTGAFPGSPFESVTGPSRPVRIVRPQAPIAPVPSPPPCPVGPVPVDQWAKACALSKLAKPGA